MKIILTLISLILIYSSLYAQNISIKSGWQLKGTEVGFNDMNSFKKDCIETVWRYNDIEKKWEAFSPKEAIQEKIKNSMFVSKLDKINPNDGFWIFADNNCTIESNSSTNLIIADAYGLKQSYNGDEEADTNYNNEKLYTAGEQWTVWGTGRTFIKIDISKIPNSAQIINLKLYAYDGDTRDGYDAKINVYKITSNWDENTVTWNTTPTFDKSKLYDSIIIKHNSIEGWYSFNITKLVQEWKNGIPNYGLILYCPDDYSGGGYRNFYSSENTKHIDKRPKIEWK